MPVLTTIDDVAQWVEGAIERFGDPAKPVAITFAKFVESAKDVSLATDEVVFSWSKEEIDLRLGPAALIPLPIRRASASDDAG